MKKIIQALTALTLAGASVQNASAGGGGWCTAGTVLAGVTAGVIIGQALAPHPAYYVAPAPAYYPTAGYGYSYYYAPPTRPAVIDAAPAPVVVYRPRVCVAPPVVSFGYYGGCRPYAYRRGYW